MRTNAKRPTAGSNRRRARPLGSSLLGALAGALALLAASPAYASQEVVNVIGGPSGDLGGQFLSPEDIAINSSGAGPADAGDIYVVDRNNRVQRFDAAGGFISAWGANAEHRKETQTIKVVATGGTFTLTFDGSTTAPLPYGIFPSSLDNALDVLPSIGGDANVSVGGNPDDAFYTVTFAGPLAGFDLPQMKAGIGGLSGGTNKNVHIVTTENGSGGGGSDYEVCTEAAKCAAAVPSGGNGTAAGNGALNQPVGLAVDDDTGNVYVSDRNNRRINVYDGEGTFIRSFGWNVAESGPGDTGTGYEVCEAADGDVCKAGAGGSGVGQYGTGSTTEAFGIAVSADGEPSAGTVFLADSGNRRVGTFGLDGSTPASFGSSAQFGSTQPRKIAVDSRGIVYASNSNGDHRIDRYDSEDANGGGVGFLEPIDAAVNEVQLVDFDSFQNGHHVVFTCPDGSESDSIEYEFGLNGTVAERILLEALETYCGNVGDFVVESSGGGFHFKITYTGNLAKTDLAQLSCASAEGGSCTVATEKDGHDGALLPPTAFGGSLGFAIDPAEDVLYVARRPDVGSIVVQQFGPGNPPGLLVPPAGDDDRHAQGAALDFGVTGLAFDGGTGSLALTQSSSAQGDRILLLAEPSSLTPPSVEMDPVATKDDSSAALSGSVDPRGALVSCQFEFSTDQQQWTGVPVDCASLPTGGGPQAVEGEASGLHPGTTYFARLAVSRPFIPGTTVVSAAQAFETDPAPPLVTDVGAIQVANTSARLVGTIDPRNAATGYVFEYGTTPALGTTTAPLEIGAGTDPITVSQVVGGLKPSTTYHFRMVATNQTGSTPSPSGEFTTRSGPSPAAGGRAWEQVTPVDKNYGDADAGFGFNKVGVSVDGNGVGFCASNQFGDPPGQMAAFCAPYISYRSGGGWQIESTPRYCKIEPESGDTQGALSLYPSADFSRVVISKAESAECQVPPLDPAAPFVAGGQAWNLYLQDPSTSPPGYTLLNNVAHSNGTQLRANYAGGSDDFSKVVLSSRLNETPEPDSPPPGSFEKLYEWEGGALRLVTRDTSNEPFTTKSALPSIGSIIGGDIWLESAVSDDGERVFFANPVGGASPNSTCQIPGCELYVREGGALTLDVSASECTVECGSPQTKADYFLSATGSGRHAFFASCAKLSDGSSPPGSCVSPFQSGGAPGSKLYRWDRDAPPGGRLIDLTADAEPVDGSQPGFRGLIGHSEDGETAYFVADGQLVPGGPKGDFEKLYRWRRAGAGAGLDYLGPYESLEGRWTVDMNWMQQRRQVTPDGEHMMLYTELAYDAAGDRDEDADVYRWDEASGWICASCQLPGVPSAGDVDLTEPVLDYYLEFFREIASVEPRIQMSEDGSRIFFGTPDALVPADVNGEIECPLDTTINIDADIYTCTDVYEWHEGTVSLVSGGADSEGAALIAASSSGRDVFFYTRERLVGWDVDRNVDIYNARLGGGFPEPEPQPAECEGEGCREEGTDAPAVAGAGTAVFQGPANPKAETQTENRCPGARLRRGKRCLTPAAIARKRCRRLSGTAKRRCVRRQAGRLRRAKRRQVRRAQRRVNRANAYRRAAR